RPLLRRALPPPPLPPPPQRPAAVRHVRGPPLRRQPPAVDLLQRGRRPVPGRLRPEDADGPGRPDTPGGAGGGCPLAAAPAGPPRPDRRLPLLRRLSRELLPRAARHPGGRAPLHRPAGPGTRAAPL